MVSGFGTAFIAISALGSAWVAPVGAALGDECDVPTNVVVPDGYLVGSERLALADEALGAYIIGYINATTLSVVFGANVQCIEKAHACISKLGTDEVGTALRRYIARDPKRLTEPASYLTFQVMYSRCVRLVETNET